MSEEFNTDKERDNGSLEDIKKALEQELGSWTLKTTHGPMARTLQDRPGAH